MCVVMGRWETLDGIDGPAGQGGIAGWLTSLSGMAWLDWITWLDGVILRAFFIIGITCPNGFIWICANSCGFY